MRGSRRTLAQYNRLFYERCWRAGSVQRLPGVDAPGAGLPVEIGCGLRPRLPLDAGVFVDFSRTACAKLRRAGAPAAVCADVLALPFRTGSLTTLHAYEVLEHVANDRAAVRELARVLAPEGSLIVSTPLHPSRWDHFDRVVGHARRYDPRALLELMAEQGLILDGFAPFGMRPRGCLLSRLGVYYLTRRPRLALRFEERWLRMFAAPDGVLIVSRSDGERFQREAELMDGAVTTWRRAG
ncbi:MAG TPA: class I SAM-dependent methyltransferase [Candidatus Binatus sp.]|nr:class I SAM-dependent methyltransferase [Candidatus Binatus sp.]